MMWSGLHIGSMLFQFSTDSACLLFMLFMFLWLLDLWASSTIYCQSILNHFRAIGKAFEAICGCITHVLTLRKPSRSTDPFDDPECEAEDVFVNELNCIGQGNHLCLPFIFQ
jgi:hypothetical protein